MSRPGPDRDRKTDAPPDTNDDPTERTPTVRAPADAPSQAAPSDGVKTHGRVQSLTDLTSRPRDRGHFVLPERIGRYEPISLLGKGSFGFVLQARDPQLDRMVAVKLQRSEAVRTRTSIDRFLREARSAAQLRHPNIVPVFEYGEFGGNHFIVYQFIDGQTLDHWIREQNPSRESRVAMIAKIASALDYAHELGIVHRDIKPANILVDSKGEPHITDFGCARIDSPDLEATADGSLMGTPTYMSPEVVAGNARSADGRADLWALGVILYEMLSGERPFAGSLPDMLRMIAEQPPKPPSIHDRTIPQDLQTICLRCLEKDPGHRFARGQELSDDLRRWSNGEPIRSRRNSVVRRLRMWAVRQPVVAGLLTTVILALGLIAGGSAWFSWRLQRQQTELVSRQLENLATAEPSALPVLLENLSSLDPSVASKLEQRLVDQPDAAPPVSLRYRLASRYLGGNSENPDRDRKLTETFLQVLPQSGFSELAVISRLAGNRITELPGRLWATAQASETRPATQLRAFCALAVIDPGNDLWQSNGGALAGLLLDCESSDLGPVCAMLQPVIRCFEGDLETMYRDDRDSLVREKSAEIFSILHVERGERLCELAADGTDGQLRRLRESLAENGEFVLPWIENNGSKFKGINAESTKVLLRALAGDRHALRGACSGSGGNSLLAHQLVMRCGPAGIEPDQLIDVLNDASAAPDFVFAGMLMLGNFDLQQIYTTRRSQLLPLLLRLYSTHPDAGVHSACRWLMNRWGFHEQLQAARLALQSDGPRDGFGWYEDPCGLCFAVFEPIGRFDLGAETGPAAIPDRDQREVDIPYRFCLSTTEVPADMFVAWENRLAETWAGQGGEQTEIWAERSRMILRNQKNRALDPAGTPAVNVTWHEVALFCNGLSNQRGLDPELQVYELSMLQSSFMATERRPAETPGGYRLPTAIEWEMACRAGSSCRWFVGDDRGLLDGWLWHVLNSGSVLKTCGELRPNRNGLFDIQGNAEEWCQNVFQKVDDEQSALASRMEVRDQSCAEEPQDFNLFRRFGLEKDKSRQRLGFRIARTISAPPAAGSD
jgi:serine/threonine protein kinase/formylglycine-generating enzyme required for sulfatase activity